MIKAAIKDADTPLAGEIIRLLVNHPDVEITGLAASSRAGQSVQAHHHGLIGEQPLRFCSELPDNANAIFFCGDTGPDHILKARAAAGEIKIINIARDAYLKTINGVPAISEIFRKPLVRGASETQILSPLETVLLIALFPLARNLMLSDRLDVNIEVAPSVIEDLDPQRAEVIAEKLLQSIQQSFHNKVIFNITPNNNMTRGIHMTTEICLAMPVKDLKPLYDDVYDDHNFTYLLPHMVGVEEVEGTNKCLIHLEPSMPDRLKVEAVADARMRGWAGEAILAMNLMFGLYERTGLQLKTSAY